MELMQWLTLTVFAVTILAVVSNVIDSTAAGLIGVVVMVSGDIMTMPGLPKVPSAEKTDLTENGKVVGLF